MVTQSPGTDMRFILKKMPFTLRVGNIPGGDTEFISIQAAMDYAGTQGGLWTIFVYPGIYDEGDLTPPATATVTIKGLAETGVYIMPAAAPVTAVVNMNDTLHLENLTVISPDWTMPAVLVNTAAGVPSINRCTIIGVAPGYSLQMTQGHLDIHQSRLSEDVHLSTARCVLDCYECNFLGDIITAAEALDHDIDLINCDMTQGNITSNATGGTVVRGSHTGDIATVTNAGTGLFTFLACYLNNVSMTNAAGEIRVQGGTLNQITRAIGPVVWWDTTNTLKVLPCTIATDTIIQWAVNAAGAGDTVLIYPGTYEEEVTLAAGINIKGVDKELCILTVPDTNTGITMAAGCSVSGLTFNVTVTGATSIGVECGDASCTIEDCNFVLQRTGGVVATAINENTNNTAATIYIRNCRIHSLVDTNITCIYIQQDNKTVYIENSWCEGGDRGLRVTAVSTVYSTNNYWESLDLTQAVVLTAAGTIEMFNDSIVGPVVQTAGTMTYRHGDAEYWVFNQMSIQDALDALPATGGKVMLMEGTWAITDPITIPQNNVTLSGQGRSSFIDGDGLATGEHGIVVSAKTSVKLIDFAMQTENGGGKVCHCIFIEDGSNNCTIQRVTIVDSDSDGIHIEGTTMYDIRIRQVNIEGADDYGIHVNMDAANFAYRFHIANCLILTTGTDGIRLGAGGAGNLYCEVNNNMVFNNTAGAGINIYEAEYSDLSNNIVWSSGADGISLNTCIHCNMQGNVVYDNADEGFFLVACRGCNLSGNVSTGNGTEGIEMDANCTDNMISTNHIAHNGEDGIEILGARNTIEDNYVSENGHHGILVGAAECQINGNYVYDNSQDTAGTYYGIYLTADALRTQVNNNYINSPGDSQGDGIHLDAGADYVQIVGNYCYNAYGGGASSGSGIYLEDNDHCLIKVNYCYLNDGYGVEIAAGSDNTVLNNKLIDNVTGQISDGGTDTILPEVVVYVPNPNSNIGAHPATLLTDGLAVMDRLDMYVPADFVELVRAQMIIVPGGTGNLRRSVATDWGKICSEVYNADSDALADDTNVAVTINVLECVDISGALDDIAAMDEVGIAFTRHGENALDTVDANCYLLKFRMQYV